VTGVGHQVGRFSRLHTQQSTSFSGQSRRRTRQLTGVGSSSHTIHKLFGCNIRIDTFNDVSKVQELGHFPAQSTSFSGVISIDNFMILANRLAIEFVSIYVISLDT